MRYADGGGLSAAGRAQREKMRLAAAAMFEQDIKPVQVAHELRVSTKSAYQWRRRWRAGGTAALASKGPGGAVSPAGPGAAGPAARRAGAGPGRLGWAEDQRWTLERVTTLIGRLFHVRYTLRGTSYLLHRIGYSPQVPVHRAAERRISAPGMRPASPCAAEGPHLGPPRPHPGGRSVRKGSGQVSATGMTCYRAGTRSRFFYRIGVHTGRKGERRSLSEADYAGLVTAAHQQLHAPVICAGTT